MEAKSQTRIAFISGDEVIDLKVLYCLFFAFPNIHIISNHSKSALKYSRYKKAFTYIPWKAGPVDQESVIDKLKQYFNDHSIEVVMTGGSDSIAFLHKYKKHFTNQMIFPTMSEARLIDIDNKWTFATRLMSAGLPIPCTLLIDTLSELDATKKELIEENIGFPLIVKPTMRDGSEGVEKIESFEALRNHILNGGEYAQLPLIVQEFVDGYDIDSSFIASKGEILSIAVQRWTGDSVLEFCRHEEIENVSRQIADIYQYNGPGHLDMRVSHNTGKLYVLECNPRFWRSVTAAMWQGLNFTEAAINSTMGQPYNKFSATGNYVMPGKKVKSILKRPWRYLPLSKIVRKELWYVLTDPLPHMLHNLRNKFGKL